MKQYALSFGMMAALAMGTPIMASAQITLKVAAAWISAGEHQHP